MITFIYVVISTYIDNDLLIIYGKGGSWGLEGWGDEAWPSWLGQWPVLQGWAPTWPGGLSSQAGLPAWACGLGRHPCLAGWAAGPGRQFGLAGCAGLVAK